MNIKDAKLLIIIIISFGLFSSFCSVHKQKKDKYILGDPNTSIPFAKDSFNLNYEAVFRLRECLTYVDNAINKYKCYIIITPWSAINETKKNSTIGILRAKAIIDFYEKTYNFKRQYFLIRDETHFNNEFWSLTSPQEGFVTFNFDFCNPNRED